MLNAAEFLLAYWSEVTSMVKIKKYEAIKKISYFQCDGTLSASTKTIPKLKKAENDFRFKKISIENPLAAIFRKWKK